MKISGFYNLYVYKKLLLSVTMVLYKKKEKFMTLVLVLN